MQVVTADSLFTADMQWNPPLVYIELWLKDATVVSILGLRVF